MDIEDKELFDSTLTDEVPETVETPAETPAAEEGQLRDDHGRFAAKQPDPEPQPEPAAASPQPAKEEASVPSWRLREIREEADRRVAETEARWQRQFTELQRQNQPKPEPRPAPDVFEDPNAFLQHGVNQAVDPIRSELQATREFYSRRDAERDHGADKVRAAYDWISQGIAQRDPEAISTYQRAMQSMHPFGDIVQAHQQRAVFQQIGGDPQAWFEKQLEERLAKDQQFAGSLMQKIQQSARQTGNPQGQSTINLPPSLSRVSSAHVATDDDSDTSDAALFRHAMR